VITILKLLPNVLTSEEGQELSSNIQKLLERIDEISTVLRRGTRLVPQRLQQIARKLLRRCERFLERIERFYKRLERNWVLRIMVSIVGGKQTMSNFLIQLRPYRDMISLALHTIILYATLPLMVI